VHPGNRRHEEGAIWWNLGRRLFGWWRLIGRGLVGRGWFGSRTGAGVVSVNRSWRYPEYSRLSAGTDAFDEPAQGVKERWQSRIADRQPDDFVGIDQHDDDDDVVAFG
jgi:hypothetical protein